MKVFVDASSLIALAEIGYITILKDIFGLGPMLYSFYIAGNSTLFYAGGIIGIFALMLSLFALGLRKDRYVISSEFKPSSSISAQSIMPPTHHDEPKSWLYCTYCGRKYPEEALAGHQRTAHPDKPIQQEALRIQAGRAIEVIDVEPLQEDDYIYPMSGRRR